MKIAVCEDDRFELRKIEEILREVLKETGITAGMECCQTGEALLEKIRKGEKYGLFLLDIILEEEKNGIEIAREILEMNPEARIAFLTSNREYAVDAFQVGAIHYLVKPLTRESVRTVLERWQTRIVRMGECLEIPDGKEIRKFPESQIMYIRSRDRGIELHMKHHKWDAWIKFPFRDVEKEVKDAKQFVRIARGCIVNLEYISGISYTECMLSNGEVLDISRREQNEVMNRYNDFLFFKMEEDGRWDS